MLLSGALAALIGVNAWVALGIGYVGSIAGGWSCQSALEYLCKKTVMTPEEIDIVNNVFSPKRRYKEALMELKIAEDTSL